MALAGGAVSAEEDALGARHAVPPAALPEDVHFDGVVDGGRSERSHRVPVGALPKAVHAGAALLGVASPLPATRRTLVFRAWAAEALGVEFIRIVAALKI